MSFLQVLGSQLLPTSLGDMSSLTKKPNARGSFPLSLHPAPSDPTAGFLPRGKEGTQLPDQRSKQALTPLCQARLTKGFGSLY